MRGPGFHSLEETTRKVSETTEKQKSVNSILKKVDVCQYFEIYKLDKDKSFHLTSRYRQSAHYPYKTFEMGSYDLWFEEYKESLKVLLYNCNYIILLNTLCKLYKTPDEKITLEIVDKCLDNLDKLNFTYKQEPFSQDIKSDLICLYLNALSSRRNRYNYNQEIAKYSNFSTHKRDVEMDNGALNNIAIDMLKNSKEICLKLKSFVDVKKIKSDRLATGKKAESVDQELNNCEIKQQFYFEQADKWIEKLESGKVDLNILNFVFSLQNQALNV